MSFNQIIQEIQQQKFKPVYYLHGEESYFIDKISKALEAPGVVLNPGEESFNKEVLYGPETNFSKIVNACRSFPMMAKYRLVVLKEAHRLNKAENEKLIKYLAQPVPSTIFVMIYKDKRAGLGKKAADAVKKVGVDFHSKKLYEKDVQQVVSGMLKQSGFEVEDGIAGILVTNLGLNLNLIENELNKMFVLLKAQQQNKLNKAFVYEMINVDKEFNTFELIAALSEKKVFRAHMIIDRLTQNAKINPPTLIVSGLFRFFHHVALVHKYQFKDPNSIKNQLKVNYFQAKDYLNGARHYNLRRTYRNLGFIEEADRSLKGMNPTNMDQRHLLKTLVWKVLA
ncbi:MAG: DNA polymerase III subunit delta [Bacteroidia bacterium]|nr:DNA polymerase III subunit delta [Bacteroidia bacterium]